MSLWKRNRIYESHVWIDGVRHRKSTGTSNRRLAEQIDQKFKEELITRRHQVPNFAPEITFAELMAKFVADGAVKPWHLDRLKILLPYFAEIRIGRINRKTIADFRKHRHEQKKLTESTVNRDIECLRHILYWAVDEGILSVNPLSRVRLERERRRKRPVLSIEEEAPLLQAASPHLRAIIIAALDTGMRRGEILNQRWEDVDFNRQLLSVTRSKTPEGEAREIPLTERVLALLSESRAAQGLIFTFQGKPLHRIKTAWKAAIRRAGIRYLPFHYLRHTYNTRLMEAGVLREVRMALMGHVHGDTHEGYEHIELPLKREAIHKLELWLNTQDATKGGPDGAAGEADAAGLGGNADSREGVAWPRQRTTRLQ